MSRDLISSSIQILYDHAHYPDASSAFPHLPPERSPRSRLAPSALQHAAVDVEGPHHWSICKVHQQVSFFLEKNSRMHVGSASRFSSNHIICIRGRARM